MPKASTERFTDRVDNYVRYRPAYPPEVLDALRHDCGLRPEHIIADIASGTGIFTRLLLENGNRVFAVEPNAEMRAASARLQQSFPDLTLVSATAERTTLPDASIDFVTVAQAAHWLEPRESRAEFRRILKPQGWCVLLWNERRVTGNAFSEDYERLLHTYCVEYKDKRHGQTAPIAQEFFAGAPYHSEFLITIRILIFRVLPDGCSHLLTVLCRMIPIMRRCCGSSSVSSAVTHGKTPSAWITTRACTSPS